MKKQWIARKEGDDTGRINGTNGNDRFEGDKGGRENVDIADVYSGRSGHDVIYGLDQGDRLSGNGGNDAIYGGSGADAISGGSGNDTLSGGMHDDDVKGGGGADVFFFYAWGGGSDGDTIIDFDPGERGERIEIATAYYDEIVTFADLKAIMVQDGDNVNMQFDFGRAFLVLEDVKIEELRANDFHLYFG